MPYRGGGARVGVVSVDDAFPVEQVLHLLEVRVLRMLGQVEEVGRRAVERDQMGKIRAVSMSHLRVAYPKCSAVEWASMQSGDRNRGDHRWHTGDDARVVPQVGGSAYRPQRGSRCSRLPYSARVRFRRGTWRKGQRPARSRPQPARRGGRLVHDSDRSTPGSAGRHKIAPVSGILVLSRPGGHWGVCTAPSASGPLPS